MLHVQLELDLLTFTLPAKRLYIIYSDLPSFEQFLVPNSRVFDKFPDTETDNGHKTYHQS